MTSTTSKLGADMTYSDDFLAWLKKDECRLYMSPLDAQYAAWRAAIESRADARQPAAIDKQDERVAFEAHIRNECDDAGYADMILRTNAHGFYHVTRIQGAWEGWQARAALTSSGRCFFCGEPMDGAHEQDCPQAANVAQYRNEALSALLVDHSHAASAKDVDAVLKARDAIYSMFANVAQGAEAVAYGEFNKARERFLSREPVAMSDSTRELARQVLERRANDTRSDEEKIQAAVNFICDTRLDDPPAQIALTDDARDAARYRFLRAGFGDMGPEVDMHNAFVDGGEVMDRTIDAALTAAQSASGESHADKA